MKTIAIIGAGKGLGLFLAKRFGKEDFQVALVARNAVKLANLWWSYGIVVRSIY
ncbi:SDR family NAD(P)-dependent oxidoreductase [Paenibacillus kribbensis]|uniref:SDR family NAD(P)-dependent oxidoreductase n=1 Tax=Paenibacillus kribbensis TaxID=172713 RepID=UPI002DB6D5F3|nr:SDR family NAD(P)-dependent oxidoreductase [Paenibacillus kribbensis]